MPWTALPFEAARGAQGRGLATRFAVGGIPRLVLVGADGQVLSNDARGAVMRDPEGQGFPWKGAGATAPAGYERVKGVFGSCGCGRREGGLAGPRSSRLGGCRRAPRRGLGRMAAARRSVCEAAPPNPSYPPIPRPLKGGRPTRPFSCSSSSWPGRCLNTSPTTTHDRRRTCRSECVHGDRPRGPSFYFSFNRLPF